MYFLFDSIGLDPTDSKKAGIRMEFRSAMPYTYYDSSTYWNTRGSIACSHPLEDNLAEVSSFTCDIATTGEKGTFMNLKIGVTKSHYQYKCSGYLPVAVD